MKAKEFAARAHHGQARKYTGEPYIVHPAEVAELCASAGLPPEAVAAAWLHDVVEDCGVTHDEVLREFGEQVAELVFFLTDKSKKSDGNRAARKAIDREHIARAPRLAKSVKAADIASNCKTIVAHDPDFAVVWLKEKALLLEVIEGDCDPTLFAAASGGVIR